VALAQRQRDAVRSKTLQRALARSRGETSEVEHQLEDAVVRANNAEERVRELEGRQGDDLKLLRQKTERIVDLEDKLRTILDSSALVKLVSVANAYEDNGLDEARPWWNLGLDHDREVPLISGRGGRLLLTIGDALDARELARVAVSLVKKVIPGEKS